MFEFRKFEKKLSENKKVWLQPARVEGCSHTDIQCVSLDTTAVSWPEWTRTQQGENDSAAFKGW